VVAHRVGHALRTAVHSAVRGLVGDEQEVAVHRHVALRAGAHVRSVQRRMARVRDVPHLVAREVALDDVLPVEREVRVDEPEVPRRARHEVMGRRCSRDQAEVPGRLTGVHPTGAQAHARVAVGGRRGRRDTAAVRTRPEGQHTNREGYRQARTHQGLLSPDDIAASMRPIRLISVVWSTLTSEAYLKMRSSRVAPLALNNSFTMVMAPWWCWIMNVRNRRSNSGPRAASSCASWGGVSMPGMSAVG